MTAPGTDTLPPLARAGVGEIVLIRHARTTVAEGVCYGRTDLPLAADPAPLAAWLRSQLPAGACVVSSPAQRCRALAEALVQGTPAGGAPAVFGAAELHIDERLCEMDFGYWEMRRYEDIGFVALDRWAADPLGFRPPGGESVSDMAARALTALYTWRNVDASALVLVTHGGPMRAIAGALLRLPAAQWTALAFRHGALTRLRRTRTGWFLAEHNTAEDGR